MCTRRMHACMGIYRWYGIWIHRINGSFAGHSMGEVGELSRGEALKAPLPKVWWETHQIRMSPFFVSLRLQMNFCFLMNDNCFSWLDLTRLTVCFLSSFAANQVAGFGTVQEMTTTPPAPPPEIKKRKQKWMWVARGQEDDFSPFN